MIRIASMIIPVAAAVALLTGAAQAGDYYERTGAGRYKPTDGAWYSSACCYKKIIKHITITKAVWVKVPPPKPQHVEADDDDAVEAPRPAPQGHPHRPQVVELGEVVHHGDKCRKPVQVKDRGITIVVMVNAPCR